MIKQLTLSGFTNFNESIFEFSHNINIFIGKNGTGKTHILKCVAAILNSNNEILQSPTQSKERYEGLLAEKLLGYFKPDQLGRLVKRQQGRSTANVELTVDNKSITFGLSTNSRTNVKIDNNSIASRIDFLYIPPREMFSLYEGFLALVDKREVSFDDTYVTLAKALNAPILKGARTEIIRDLIMPLENALKLEVIKENGRFYIKDENGKMEAHLVAEGLRKLSSVMYLILNGELGKNTVLFWDEPEANLNPALIKIIADFIIILAQKGVQVFIASHDYLLTHLLSLKAEYRDIDPTCPDIKFFCLNKSEEKIAVEEANTLANIQNNPILDEYAAFYDLAQEYSNQRFNSRK